MSNAVLRPRSWTRVALRISRALYRVIGFTAICLSVLMMGAVQVRAAKSKHGWDPVVKVAGARAQARKRTSRRVRSTPVSRVKPVTRAEKNKPEVVRRSTPRVQHSELTRKYCENITDAASDARYAWQSGELKKLQADLDDRLKKMVARTLELKAWLERRKAFVQDAQKGLVKIYTGMSPDAAAQQLVAMDEITASALIAQFKPRTASAILNEMKPRSAARLASIIAGAAKVENGIDGASVPDGGRKQ